MTKALFIALLLFCITPWCSPPLALALGILTAFSIGHPWRSHNSRATRLLLQASVVGLGFGMDLAKVIEAGRQGLGFTIATITGTLAMGWLIGTRLGIGNKLSHLVASGTAICGGSAIAAVAPVIDASEEEISVSLGTVFILNAIALFVFPVLGLWMGLSQAQFGIWSAIAIHDTSSVVGAAARYGEEALKIATTIKLTRALWIIPLVLGTAWVFQKRQPDGDRAKIDIPWFIVYFFAASLMHTGITMLYPAEAIFGGVAAVAKTGLTVTLFLIGAGLSKTVLQSVGLRPMLLGVLLWILVSIVSFFAVTGMVD